MLKSAEKYGEKGWAFKMEACYVEIYNETVRDLLRPGAAHSDKHTILSAAPGLCPTVAGVVREPVDSMEAAAGLVRRAAAARAVEATAMNATSSRSHTLFMLYITGTHEGSGTQLEGCLNLARNPSTRASRPPRPPPTALPAPSPPPLQAKGPGAAFVPRGREVFPTGPLAPSAPSQTFAPHRPRVALLPALASAAHAHLHCVAAPPAVCYAGASTYASSLQASS